MRSIRYSPRRGSVLYDTCNPPRPRMDWASGLTFVGSVTDAVAGSVYLDSGTGEVYLFDGITWLPFARQTGAST